MQLIAVFQLVFQRNLKTHISQLNQISKKLIQITPAHQISVSDSLRNTPEARPVRAFLFLAIRSCLPLYLPAVYPP